MSVSPTMPTGTASVDHSEVALPRPVALVARAMSVAAGVLLIALIMLTVADVVSRNLRDHSIVGAVDMSTMLLVAAAFLGLASAELDGKHVTVDLFEARFAPRARWALSLLRAVILLALGVLLTWGLSEVLLSALERGETTNDVLRLPTWPAKAVLVVSFLAYFVVAVWKELRAHSELTADLADEQSGDHR